MGITIHVNGRSNSLVHKGSGGRSKCTLPDVCKTPSPGGPVPVPYPVIISLSSDLKKGSKKVKFDGGNSAAIKGSEFSRCSGDEAGTAGGVKSSTNMKEATWILYSFDVKIEGKNACRLSDKMMMNHGNTACLSGTEQEKKDGEKIEEILCIHCGISLNDKSHEDAKLDSDNKSLQKQAVNSPKAGSGHTKGGIQVGDNAAIFSGSGNPVVPRNLATGQLLKIDLEDIFRWKATRPNKGFDPGNCVEQSLLDKAFPVGGAPYPPPGGPGKIKMGIAQAARTSRKEKPKPVHKVKCATCEELMVAMLCTNPAKPKNN